jgi:hypothetical protein
MHINTYDKYRVFQKVKALIKQQNLGTIFIKNPPYVFKYYMHSTLVYVRLGLAWLSAEGQTNKTGNVRVT